MQCLKSCTSLTLAPSIFRVLLELDPTTDPVWIYFDTQHHHIMQVLRNSHKHAVSKYQGELVPCRSARNNAQQLTSFARSRYRQDVSR